MKRLFCIVDRNNGKEFMVGSEEAIEGKYFAAKADAKKIRDELNPPLKEDQSVSAARQYYVSLGPDHGNYKGETHG